MAEEDKNIEEFFRKFSESYSSRISFNEAHWKDLEDRLDQEFPVAPASSRGRWLTYVSDAIPVIVGLLLTIAVVWNGQVQGQVQRQELSPAAMITGVDPAQTEDAMGVSSADALTPATAAQVEPQDPAKPEGALSTTSAGVKDLNHTINATKETPLAADLVGKSVNEEETGISLRTKGIGNPDQPVLPAADGERGNVSGTALKTTIPGEPSELLGEAHQLLDPPLQSLRPDENQLKYPSTRTVALIVDDTSPVKGPALFPRFSVGVGFSPDLSSNQLGAYNRAGSELGVVIGYRFKSRWSVEVGVLSARKNYKVAGEEYSQSYEFWEKATDGELPSTIDAKCHVLDIPINLRYRILMNEVSSLSASLGLSSYLMLSEDYAYELTYGSGAWGTKHENDHLLSVANMQVHYERMLGRQFAIEAAPFIKLPLTGFGHGDIKFHSLGLFITAKRYFHLK